MVEDKLELRGVRLNILVISQRPAEAADRAVPGHWEGDLVFGRGMSQVAMLVECSTRYLILVGCRTGTAPSWSPTHWLTRLRRYRGS